ncbi:hypothetical protein HBI95_141990 [Parastagonospora nodorum]|nr:hypothetical protein HBI95_141990 [Parastagonospora nodorum]
MCAKDNLVERKSPLLTSTQTWKVLPNYVDTFGLDFAFSFANILSLITFIISYRLFADELWNIQQSLLDRATVVLIIILVNKTQLLLISGDRSTPSTLLAKFIPITKIRDPLLKTLENAAKSGILLACADRRTRQCYLTICAILKHYNFNIYVSLATDTLHLLLKGLVIKMLDFMQDMLDDIYPSTVVSLLFVLKAPFALHFIYAVCDLVTLAQYKKEEKNFNYSKWHALIYIIQDIRMYRALDSICTEANSEAHHITMPYSTKLPLSKVAANIAISDFTHTAAQSSSKRHNDPEHCDKEVLYLILIIIDYICYDKDRKYIAYIRAFSKNAAPKRWILQAFKFYDLSTIIRLVHLVLRDLPNLTTRTTMSYYINNYID